MSSLSINGYWSHSGGGYVNDGAAHVQLLYKPLFTFPFDSFTYSSDSLVASLVTHNGVVANMTDPQKLEVNTYVRRVAKSDPWLATRTPSRVKIETVWDNLTGITLLMGIQYNIVSLLKGKPKDSDFAPFINTTVDKLFALPVDSVMNFKFNIQGTWSATNNQRAMTVDFLGTSSNSLTINRSFSKNPDIINFITFFAIDRDGDIQGVGTPPVIQAEGANFTMTKATLIIDQLS